MFACEVGSTRSRLRLARLIPGRHRPAQLDVFVLRPESEQGCTTPDFDVIRMRAEGQDPKRTGGWFEGESEHGG